ncbi:hypothetical protein [Nocardia pseudovaccinii]|uniref:hypothetical protein n=1 Tax=Nocardia pseudovaccinii TaxID=189540 RepID=UPI000B13B1C2|nr:hypothetical protein [Nocardia pseudovaccinii]
MIESQIKLIQHGAMLIGKFERRGQEETLKRIFKGDNDDGVRAQQATDALVIYSVVAGHRLITLKDASFDEALDGTREFKANLIPAEPDWSGVCALIKLIAGTTGGGSAPTLTQTGAFVAAFDIAIALTRQIATEEGMAAKLVADDICAKCGDLASLTGIFDLGAASMSWIQSATDQAARELRRATADIMIRQFASAGTRLLEASTRFASADPAKSSVFGHGDDRIAAVGYLILSTSSLGSAIAGLVDTNPYPAWALMRQLVEVEYLAWAFAENSDEAGAWLRSTKQERTSQFSPRHVYRKTNNSYRSQDYELHCELAGHPTPTGLRMLGSQDPRIPEGALSEFINHGGGVWEHIVAVAKKLANEHSVPLDDFLDVGAAEEVTGAVTRWRTEDPSRLNVQLFAGTAVIQ